MGSSMEGNRLFCLLSFEGVIEKIRAFELFKKRAAKNKDRRKFFNMIKKGLKSQWCGHTCGKRSKDSESFLEFKGSRSDFNVR